MLNHKRQHLKTLCNTVESVINRRKTMISNPRKGGLSALFFFFFVVYVDMSFGHSLKIEIEEDKVVNDQKYTDDAKNFAHLAEEKKRIGDFDSAIVYYGYSLDLLNDLEGEGLLISKILNNIANIFSDRGDLIKSLDYYLRSLKVVRELGDSSRIAQRLINIGLTYSDLNYYESAINCFQEAVTILEDLSSNEKLANVYSSIGLLLHKNRRYEEALEYHYMALNINKALSDTLRLSESYNNVGIVYLDTRILDSAEFLLQQALYLKRFLENPMYCASSLINLSEVALLKNDFNKSEEYLFEVFELISDKKTPYVLANAYLNYGKLYIAKKSYSQAVDHLNRSMALAIDLKDNKLIFDIYEQYQTLYEQWGNYEKAYLYSQKYHALKDSLIDEERIRVAEWNKELEKREVEKEKVIAEQRASLATEENRRQKVWILALSAIAFIFVLLGSIIWANRKRIRRQNVELLKKNRIIEIQKADIRHQTKNGLLRVRNILKLLKRDLNDERSAMELEKAENMILALTALEDYLFDQPEDREVEMGKFLSMLKEKLVTAHGMEEKISIEVESGKVTLHLNVAIPIALIISETVTNSIKHAFENVDFPLIKLLFKKTKENYRLVIRDNGQGLQHNGSPGGGWGSEIVKSYVKQLKGSIDVRHEGGLVNEFLFPLQ